MERVYLINVTFSLPHNLKDDFTGFVREDLIPELSGNTPGFPVLSEIVPHDEVEDDSLSMALMWKTVCAGDNYAKDMAITSVLAPVAMKYGEKVLFFITLLKPESI